MKFRFIIKFHGMPDYVSPQMFDNRHDALMAGVQCARTLMASCPGDCCKFGKNLRRSYHGVLYHVVN